MRKGPRFWRRMADCSPIFGKNRRFLGPSVGDSVHRYILQMIDYMIVTRRIGVEKPGFQGEGGYPTGFIPCPTRLNDCFPSLVQPFKNHYARRGANSAQCNCGAAIRPVEWRRWRNLSRTLGCFRGPILEALLNIKSMGALGCCRHPFVIGAHRAERHRSNCANKPTITPCGKLRRTIPYAG